MFQNPLGFTRIFGSVGFGLEMTLGMDDSSESLSFGNYYLSLRDRHFIDASSDDEEGLVAQLVRAHA